MAPSDITLGRSGCATTSYNLPSHRRISSPELRVDNHAEETMVLALPDVNLALSVPPGERRILRLTAVSQQWESIAYFCLSEAHHARLMEGVTQQIFVCGLDSYDLQYRASATGLPISRGTLLIESRPASDPNRSSSSPDFLPPAS